MAWFPELETWLVENLPWGQYIEVADEYWSDNSVATTDFANDEAAAYATVQGWLWRAYDFQFWSDDTLYRGLEIVDAAHKSSGGDVVAFWSYLKSKWPKDPSVPGWDTLAAAWGSAKSSAKGAEATKFSKLGPFIALGALGVLGVVLWKRL